MASHNIFSDTELGGKLTFRQIPADGTTISSVLGIMLPVGGLAELVKFSREEVQLFIGVAGNQYEYAFFGTGNALSSGPQLKRDAAGANVFIDADLSLLTNRKLFVTTLSAAGTTPANLKVAVFDGTQLKVVNAPTIQTGKVYYFRIGASGFEWNEQDPAGGGTPTGVTGSGVAGYAAKWNTGTELKESTLEFTSTGAIQHSNFEINPSERVFAVTYTPAPLKREWFFNKNYLPPFSSGISATSRVVVNEADIMMGADAPFLRSWLSVYTIAEINTALLGFLPLTAGTSKPLSGDLLVAKAIPQVLLQDTVGQVMGMTNVNGVWVLFQENRSFGAPQNALEYYSGTGDFRVFQFNASANPQWQSLAVATRQWTSENYSPLGHTHVPGHISLSGTGVLVGGGPGSATEITMGSGMQIVGSVLSTTALVSSVGLSMPGHFTVANTPISSSGTFAVSWINVAANSVFVGPPSGNDAQPDFRKIVAADIPTSALGAGTANASTVLLGNRTWGTISGGGISFPGATQPHVANNGGWKVLGGEGEISIADAGSSGFMIQFNSSGFAKVSGSTTNRLAYWTGAVTLGASPVEIRAGNFVAVGGVYALAVDTDNLWVAGRRFPMPPIDPLNQTYVFRPSTSTLASVWGGWEPFTGGGNSMPEPDADGEPYVRVRAPGQSTGVWKKLVGENRWV